MFFIYQKEICVSVKVTLAQNWAQIVISSWPSPPNNTEMEEPVPLQRWNRRSLYYGHLQNVDRIAWIRSYCRSDGIGISTFGAKELFTRNDTAQEKKSKFPPPPPKESNLWLSPDESGQENSGRFDSCWWDSDFFFWAACFTNLKTLFFIISLHSLFSHKP